MRFPSCSIVIILLITSLLVWRLTKDLAGTNIHHAFATVTSSPVVKVEQESSQQEERNVTIMLPSPPISARSLEQPDSSFSNDLAQYETAPLVENIKVSEKNIGASDTNSSYGQVSGQSNEGSVLLYLAEAGQGPEISLEWPASAKERIRIRNAFSCLGMVVTLYDGSNFYRLSDAPRTHWGVDLSFYSAYIRPIHRFASPEEASEIGELKQHHGKIGQPIRLFPRSVDESLLSGLMRSLGERYLSTNYVHGVYNLVGDNIVVNVTSTDSSQVSHMQHLVKIPLRCGAKSSLKPLQ
jgi:hypothetical protein